MIYVDSRPVTRFAKPGLRPRFYQFRQFVGLDQIAEVEALGELVQTTERFEEVFLIPGRDEHVVKLIDNETFSMRTLLDRKKNIEHWEVTAREPLPLRRGLSAMIGARVPRMRAALMSFVDAEKLSEAMAKRLKRIQSQTTIREFAAGEVKIFHVKQRIEEDEVHSVVLRADSPDYLHGIVAKLPLEPQDGQNLGDYLRAA